MKLFEVSVNIDASELCNVIGSKGYMIINDSLIVTEEVLNTLAEAGSLTSEADEIGSIDLEP